MMELTYRRYWYGCEWSTETLLLDDDAVVYKLGDHSCGAAYLVKDYVLNNTDTLRDNGELWTSDYIVKTKGECLVSNGLDNKYKIAPLFQYDDLNFYKLFCVRIEHDLEMHSIEECEIEGYVKILDRNYVEIDEEYATLSYGTYVESINKIEESNDVMSISKIRKFKKDIGLEVSTIHIKHWLHKTDLIQVSIETIPFKNLYEIEKVHTDDETARMYEAKLDEYMKIFKE